MTPATPRAGSPQSYGDFLKDFLVGITRVPTITKVYPLYIISCIKKALPFLNVDTERLLRSVGDIKTVGDCVHTLSVTDFNGTKYTITVEVKS